VTLTPTNLCELGAAVETRPAVRLGCRAFFFSYIAASSWPQLCHKAVSRSSTADKPENWQRRHELLHPDRFTTEEQAPAQFAFPCYAGWGRVKPGA